MAFRYAGVKLTGLKELKGAFKGETAVVGCSGTTFARYNDDLPPRAWKRFAVNEGIRKMADYADFWVMSDDPIVFEYMEFIRPQVTCLVMKQATRLAKHLRGGKAIYTVDSMRDPKDYGNGFQFFSRGTVLIGAIEMARYLGFERFFVFGCDCYRTKTSYYYDDRKPPKLSETKVIPHDRARETPPNVQLYVTPLLKKMINRLEMVAPLWKGIKLYCVDSEYSQQTVMEKITIDDFRRMITEEETDKAPEEKTPALKEEKKNNVKRRAKKKPANSRGEPDLDLHRPADPSAIEGLFGQPGKPESGNHEGTSSD